MTLPYVPSEDEKRVTQCPKCKAVSGDDWEQCRGACPMPGSPHFIADFIEQGAHHADR